jgi:hypothetical protein
VKLYATTATNNLANIFMVRFVSGAPLTRFPLRLWLCECYRYGACVGFCDATYEMMLAPSLEIAPKLWRRLNENCLEGVSAKRHSKMPSDTDALQSDKYTYS